MHYVFVVNNRSDKAFIREEVVRQTDGLDISHEIYLTIGVGDATRFVRSYCTFNPEKEVCFVACGGCGTLNEVVSAMVGFGAKSVAFLAMGNTNDFAKNYPGRNFASVRDILQGEHVKVDIIKANDDYAINVINIGFDAMVSYKANALVDSGRAKNAYARAIVSSIFHDRFKRLGIVADGERISRWHTLLCTLGNGRWCGGDYLCTPRAVLDDGLMDMTYVRSCPLSVFLMLLKHYKGGTQFESSICRRWMTLRKVKKVEVTSRELLYVSLDGEIVASTSYVFEILPGAIELLLPKLV